MSLTEDEIKSILEKNKLKKDTYNFIKYSDEIVERAQREFSNILNRASIIQIIGEMKNERKLKSTATLSKFKDIIIEQLGLFQPIKIINEYKEDIITRYVATYTHVSHYEIALSLLSKSFLSHYSALYVNDLTLNQPKDIYINKEQSSKNSYSNENTSISQDRIDYAFSKKMRRTNMIYSFTYNNTSYKVHVLNSKNTNNTGIVTKKVMGFSSPVRTTNIERTLIDTTVRPGYSGGPLEILEAFSRSKDMIDLQKLWNYLNQFSYSYPYYKSIAFYLKHTGYKYQEELQRLYSTDSRNILTFYLDYQMIEPLKDDELNIFYPKLISKI